MKFLIFMWSLVFGLTTFSIQDSILMPLKVEEQKYEDKDVVSEIAVRFNLGTTKSNCQKSGICELMVGHDFGLLIGNAGGGIASNYEGNLQLNVSKSTMGIETMAKFFSGGSFIMQGNFDIPLDIFEALNLENSFIDIGVYEVEDMGETLRIRFQMTQVNDQE